MNEEVVLRTQGLTKYYAGGVRAVQDLDLTVRQGEVYGFLGPNGAGKTTTISIILGLIAPTAGEVELLGRRLPTARGVGSIGDNEEWRRVLRRVGAVVEEPAYFPFLSGRDNLAVAARELGGAAEERIGKLLNLVELEGQAGRKVKTYSQGMKQRLALAMALLNAPQILFLDEPTNGLDPAGQREIRALISRLAQEGTTIFLCSHLLHEVEQICDRVGVLKQGVLIAEGAVTALLRRGQWIQLRLAETATGAEVVRELAWVGQVRVEGDRLMVEAPVERSSEINAALAERSLYAAEIRPLDTTLESFFLEITEAEETAHGA
jgi:ABC-2 type transport system ATP-binding protein